MRILCCVNADVVSSYALNLLLPTLASHEVCVGLSTRIGARVRDANEPAPRRELRAAEQGFAELVFPLIERSEELVAAEPRILREELGLVDGRPIVVVLPGSRRSEVGRLMRAA